MYGRCGAGFWAKKERALAAVLRGEASSCLFLLVPRGAGFVACLFARGDSAGGADIGAGAAVYAHVGSDGVLFALGDCAGGTFVNAGAASDTVVTNYVSHDVCGIIDCYVVELSFALCLAARVVSGSALSRGGAAARREGADCTDKGTQFFFSRPCSAFFASRPLCGVPPCAALASLRAAGACLCFCALGNGGFHHRLRIFVSVLPLFAAVLMAFAVADMVFWLVVATCTPKRKIEHLRSAGEGRIFM